MHNDESTRPERVFAWIVIILLGLAIAWVGFGRVD